MKRYEGILLCSDLDGTLYTSGTKQISPENLEAVKYFISNSGQFTFASGRPPEYFGPLVELFGTSTPVIGLSGSAIYDFNKGQYVHSQLLADSSIKVFNGILDQYQDDISVVCIEHLDKTYEYHKGKSSSLEEIKEIFAKVDKNEVFINFFEAQTASDLRQKMLADKSLLDDMDFVRSWPECFEILPRNGNKGAGVKALKEILGNVTKTVCVGNYENDVAMIEYADIGYAVGNSCDELKAVADAITVTNNESAIAKIIYEL